MLLLLLGATCSLAATSHEVYTPSSSVRDWHKYDFEVSSDYARKVAIRALPLFVIGVILFLLFLLWSTCRLCRCIRPTETDKCRKSTTRCYTVLLVLLALASVALLSYGLSSNEEQDDALDKVPALVDEFITFKEDAAQEIQILIQNGTDIINQVSALLNDPSFTTFADPGTVQDAQNTLATSTQYVNQLNDQTLDQLNSIDLSSVRSDITDKGEEINDIRFLAVVILLAVLLGLLLARTLIALSDAYGPRACLPRKTVCWRPITFTTSVLLVLSILLVWVLCGAMLMIVTFFADFCVSPTSNIIREASITQPEAVYYLSCHESGQPNPFLDDANTARQQVTSALSSMNDVVTQLQTSCAGACDSTVALAQDISTALEKLLEKMGGDLDNNGSLESGVWSLVSCEFVNGKYQALLNASCDEFFTALVKFMIVLLAFAIILVFLEFVKRKHPVQPRHEELVGEWEQMKPDRENFAIPMAAVDAAAPTPAPKPEAASQVSYGFPEEQAAPWSAYPSSAAASQHAAAAPASSFFTAYSASRQPSAPQETPPSGRRMQVVDASLEPPPPPYPHDEEWQV
eukprot:m.239822 g.239822  ORF g.239822 m.239822 type:complete len:575 (+) comp22520_c3_seq33:90-1814(+)